MLQAVPLLALLVSVWFAPLAAQEVVSLAPGMRIRASAAVIGLDRQVGRLTSIRGDTLLLIADARTGGVAIPIAALDSVQVWRSHKLNGWGALLGGGIGLAGGIASGYASHRGASPNSPPGWFTPATAFAGAVIGSTVGAGGRMLPLGVGAGVGAVIGAVLGASSCGDEGCSQYTSTIGALFFSVPGGVLGGVTAALLPGGRWQPVPLPRKP